MNRTSVPGSGTCTSHAAWPENPNPEEPPSRMTRPTGAAGLVGSCPAVLSNQAKLAVANVLGMVGGSARNPSVNENVQPVPQLPSLASWPTSAASETAGL